MEAVMGQTTILSSESAHDESTISEERSESLEAVIDDTAKTEEPISRPRNFMRGLIILRVILVILMVSLAAVFFSLLSSLYCVDHSLRRGVIKHNVTNVTYAYDRNIPIVFIGGMPRSGTTLMRVLLDAHNMVECGEETRLVPRIIQMRDMWRKTPKEARKLAAAGISDDIIDHAVASFILEITVRHGEPAERFCNKDPFLLQYAVYLRTLFPHSKYLFMVRDGRGTVHSIIKRKVSIGGFNLTSHRQCMEKWNTVMGWMYDQCREVGPQVCMLVYYEQLVLQPKIWLEKIAEFLDLPWDDAMLRHEALVGRPGGISVSDVERSTDQVIKPINIDALGKWVGTFPQDVLDDMHKLAPLLQKLGYNPNSSVANYGVPDGVVLNNTLSIRAQQELWLMKAKEVISLEKDSENWDDLKEEAQKAGLLHILVPPEAPPPPAEAPVLESLPVPIDNSEEEEEEKPKVRVYRNPQCPLFPRFLNTSLQPAMGGRLLQNVP